MTDKQSVVRDRAIVAQEIQCLTLVLISQSPVGSEYYGERISVSDRECMSDHHQVLCCWQWPRLGLPFCGLVVLSSKRQRASEISESIT